MEATMLDNGWIDLPTRDEAHPVPGTDSLEWEALHLERKFWTDATLELRLEVRDVVICRSLATRHGMVFLGDRGPEWAQELLEEAAQEWRRRLPVVQLPLSLFTWTPSSP
jgi:hypothetical protein